MVSLFFSYSHKDEALRDQLEVMLSTLKRQGIISTWHDRRIGAGQEFADAIDRHVETDDIILLLVSPDFIASDYCYDREMIRAMERHDAGEAIVIPVILRPCDWLGTPFGKLNATPPDGKAITSLPNRDEAMLEVAKAVRGAAERAAPRAPVSNPREPARTMSSLGTEESFSVARQAAPFGPRSSNLALAKSFSQRDRDAFKLETFEYIAKFFQNSLAELGARNPGIEGAFRQIDANRFSAIVYRNGDAVPFHVAPSS